MALSEAEKLSCFECLEAFWASSVDITNGYGTVLALSDIDILKTNITARLAALDAASLIKVSALIVRWDAIAMETAKITSGTAGNTTGVDMDPEAARAQIRKLMHTYVPVLHMVEAIKRRLAPGGMKSGIIPINL